VLVSRAAAFLLPAILRGSAWKTRLTSAAEWWPGLLPLVIAEIGINHEGSFDKAVRMVEAPSGGCECVKLQCHIVDDEMIENDVVRPTPMNPSGI